MIARDSYSVFSLINRWDKSLQRFYPLFWPARSIRAFHRATRARACIFPGLFLHVRARLFTLHADKRRRSHFFSGVLAFRPFARIAGLRCTGRCAAGPTIQLIVIDLLLEEFPADYMEFINCAGDNLFFGAIDLNEFLLFTCDNLFDTYFRNHL